MPVLIAPFSCRQAAYTSGRSEKPRVKFGRNPKTASSVSYMAATGPAAAASDTDSMYVTSDLLSTLSAPILLPARGGPDERRVGNRDIAATLLGAVQRELGTLHQRLRIAGELDRGDAGRDRHRARAVE